MQRLLLLTLTMTIALSCSCVHAETYGGIEFPNGDLSFADAVLRYDPLYGGGPAPTAGTDPQAALGIPDWVGNDDEHATLGRGGLLELLFVDNYLVNSGGEGHDLHIFEVGPDVEDTYVAIRPTAETALILDPATYDANEDGFYEIGKVYGSTSSIDIDAIFPGYLAGELVFDAVQLIDDYNEGGSSGSTVGADIDAVGAIGSIRSCDYSLMGDLNGDCRVDLLDLAKMASNWLIDCKQTPGDPACVPLD
ncbi:hypothetical protein SMSP2_02849 [Limihaloglobus sulfuriphilus]|uniref:Dockerin domain-containing protein n=1 Tax=Limihaloglobus sulfuriphilus TaxID=1851148 RepID=A0A1Q2MIH4_9BACT|nr:hypothetical protein [Limihaloglobus sulfuriphilus]AQQ72464.1 hypothetical protein SMSP2_02849 [Limihaloglobus sulfuriphilus]